MFHSSLVEENLYRKNKDESESEEKPKYNHLDERRAACYESVCRVDKFGKPELIILIDYLEIKCPRAGAILTVDGYKGSIECPKAETVSVTFLIQKLNIQIHQLIIYFQTSQSTF